MSRTLLEQVEARICDALGVDLDTVGRANLGRLVGQLHHDSGLDPAGWLAGLRPGSPEMHRLAEAVVVSETWFSRERAGFAAYRAFLRQELPRLSTDGLRALSLPCATGEEAWGLAAIALGRGLRDDRLRVEGWDVSRAALARAEAGAYGARSFRERLDAELEAQLDTVGAYRRVSPRLRAVVHFEHHNAVGLDPGVLAERSRRYDVIFCRNLVIYLRPAARRRLFDTLLRLLRPGGLLVTAAVDAATVPLDHFERAPDLGITAFRSPLPALSPPEERRVARRPRPWTPGAPMRRTEDRPRAARGAEAPATSGLASDPTSDPTSGPASDPLERAAACIAEGRLDEARRLCDQVLQQEPTSAPAAFQVGRIHDLRGQLGEAERWLRRTVYLDPTHEAALLQLASVISRLGREAAASRLRRQAARVHERARGGDA